MSRASTRVASLSLLLALAGCVHQENWSDRDPVEATAADPYVAVLTAFREVTGDATYLVHATDAETQTALVAIDDQLAVIDAYTDESDVPPSDRVATVTLSASTRSADEYAGEISAVWLDTQTLSGWTRRESYSVRCHRGECRAELRFKSEGVIVPPPAEPDSTID